MECAVPIGGNLTNWFQARVECPPWVYPVANSFQHFLDFVRKDVGSLDGILNMTEHMILDIH